jgi:hypothetical protein
MAEGDDKLSSSPFFGPPADGEDGLDINKDGTVNAPGWTPGAFEALDETLTIQDKTTQTVMAEFKVTETFNVKGIEFQIISVSDQLGETPATILCTPVGYDEERLEMEKKERKRLKKTRERLQRQADQLRQAQVEEARGNDGEQSDQGVGGDVEVLPADRDDGQEVTD